MFQNKGVRLRRYEEGSASLRAPHGKTSVAPSALSNRAQAFARAYEICHTNAWWFKRHPSPPQVQTKARTFIDSPKGDTAFAKQRSQMSRSPIKGWRRPPGKGPPPAEKREKKGTGTCRPADIALRLGVAFRLSSPQSALHPIETCTTAGMRPTRHRRGCSQACACKQPPLGLAALAALAAVR